MFDNLDKVQKYLFIQQILIYYTIFFKQANLVKFAKFIYLYCLIFFLINNFIFVYKKLDNVDKMQIV